MQQNLNSIIFPQIGLPHLRHCKQGRTDLSEGFAPSIHVVFHVCAVLQATRTQRHRSCSCHQCPRLGWWGKKGLSYHFKIKDDSELFFSFFKKKKLNKNELGDASRVVDGQAAVRADVDSDDGESQGAARQGGGGKAGSALQHVQ